jgi:glycosyltransferase involved in cell wall biosynthesis
MAAPDTPRITVLIGCWNNADTILRAVDSIRAQTLEDFELIVVDDGSTDASAELVDAVDDERVRRLPLTHMGIARSLNRGLEAAAAPYVAVLDADDVARPERLERQVAVLDANPEIAVVGTRMAEVDAEGNGLIPRTAFRSGNVNKVLMRFNPIPNTSAAYRRDAALAVGGYDPRWLYATDYDLWLKLAEHHVVATIDDELSIRYMSGTNVSGRHERRLIAEAIGIRLAALKRRRTLRGARGLVLPTISYVAPLSVKRRVRCWLGQPP